MASDDSPRKRPRLRSDAKPLNPPSTDDNSNATSDVTGDVSKPQKNNSRATSSRVTRSSTKKVEDSSESPVDVKVNSKRKSSGRAGADKEMAHEHDDKLKGDKTSSPSLALKSSHANTSSPPEGLKPKANSEMTEDEALARRLQSEYDGEHAQATSGLHGLARDNDPSDATTQHAPDAQSVQMTVRDFAQPLTKMKCTKCRRLLFKDSDIESFAQVLLKQKNPEIGELSCGSCGTAFSIVDLRMVKIWILLCSFDTKSKHNKVHKQRKAPQGPEAGRPRGNGTGYGGSARGVGYGGDELDDGWLDETSAFPAPAVSKYGPGRTLGSALPPSSTTSSQSPAVPFPPLGPDDAMTSSLMACLTKLLPSIEREDDFDGNPPTEQLQCILLCSSILERAADLLRNNDLANVTSCAILYLSLTKLAHALSAHPSTSRLVFGERVVRSPGANILQISLGKSDLVTSQETDSTQPLSQCLRELGGQAELMLKQRNGDPNDITLFTEIKGLYNFMAANVGAAEKKSTAEKNAWHRDLAISDAPDEDILSRHSLATKTGADTGTRAPGQMKRIMQEIARLKAGLPDGIFVRYCETRPDVMKILIIGPKDSPYENGLFEFDLLCDTNFPKGPPKMDFRTTGGGMVRFNPNLYPCGKICLSILGTWAGEPWNEKQSTLLQILVSIQAMIFCEFPYQNEPSQESVPGNSFHSLQYNRSIQTHTIRSAMLDWLESKRFDKSTVVGPYHSTAKSEPKYDPSGIWSEIVKQHFEDNREEIMASVKKWVDEPVPKQPDPYGRTRRPTPFPSDSNDSASEDDDDDDAAPPKGPTDAPAKGAPNKIILHKTNIPSGITPSAPQWGTFPMPPGYGPFPSQPPPLLHNPYGMPYAHGLVPPPGLHPFSPVPGTQAVPPAPHLPGTYGPFGSGQILGATPGSYGPLGTGHVLKLPPASQDPPPPSSVPVAHPTSHGFYPPSSGGYYVPHPQSANFGQVLSTAQPPVSQGPLPPSTIPVANLTPDSYYPPYPGFNALLPPVSAHPPHASHGSGQVVGGSAAQWPSFITPTKKGEKKGGFAGTGWKGQVLGVGDEEVKTRKVGEKKEVVEKEKKVPEVEVGGELVEFLRDALDKLKKKMPAGHGYAGGFGM